MLLQYQQNQLKVIGYGSRTLTPAEKKYHSSKLEFLPVKWAVCNHFRDYLYYVPHFKIHTDNNPVTYITTTGRLSATGQRWVNMLAEFNFSIHYSPGKQNVIADTLSRPSPSTYVECMEACTELISPDQVKTILDAAESQHQQSDIWSVCLNTVMVEEQQKILDSLTTPTKCFNIDGLKKGQQSEHWIVRVKNIVKENAVLTPDEKKKEPPDVQRLLREQSKLSVNDNDLLYRKSNDYQQIILLCRYKEAVYKELHMHMIHPGADRTLQLIRERFYWPGMEEEVRYFISNLCTCVGQKKPPIQGQAPLLPIITSSPLEVVGVDFLHLEKSSGGFEHVITNRLFHPLYTNISNQI